MTAAAIVAGVLVGVTLGGRLRFLAAHRLVGWWLLVPGVVAPVLADRWDLGGWAGVTVVGAYVCLLGFAVVNRMLKGIGVVAVGLGCNLVVVGVNTSMPVHTAAVVRANLATPSTLSTVPYGHRHHAETERDQLTFLDDRIPVPALRQVFSIGDLIQAVGVAAVTANALRTQRRRSLRSRPRRFPRRRRGARPPLPTGLSPRPGSAGHDGAAAVASCPGMPPMPRPPMQRPAPQRPPMERSPVQRPPVQRSPVQRPPTRRP